jgi:hypothetical protein
MDSPEYGAEVSEIETDGWYMSWPFAIAVPDQ